MEKERAYQTRTHETEKKRKPNANRTHDMERTTGTIQDRTHAVEQRAIKIEPRRWNKQKTIRSHVFKTNPNRTREIRTHAMERKLENTQIESTTWTKRETSKSNPWHGTKRENIQIGSMKCNKNGKFQLEPMEWKTNGKLLQIEPTK